VLTIEFKWELKVQLENGHHVSDTRHSRGLANGLASDNKVGVPPSGPPIAVLCEDILGLSFTGTGSWCLRKKSSSKVFTPGLRIRNPGFLIVRCKAIVANFGGIVHGCTEADLFKTDICKKNKTHFHILEKVFCIFCILQTFSTNKTLTRTRHIWLNVARCWSTSGKSSLFSERWFYALSKTTNVTVKFVRTWQIGKLAKLFALNQWCCSYTFRLIGSFAAQNSRSNWLSIANTIWLSPVSYIDGVHYQVAWLITS